MTTHQTRIPEAATPYSATPFKIFIPRVLEAEPAKALWDKLDNNQSVVQADPFAMSGVSTVFPGVFFDVVGAFNLGAIHVILQEIEAQYPEAFEDAWVELWVPDALTDPAEALDVTDLTDR